MRYRVPVLLGLVLSLMLVRGPGIASAQGDAPLKSPTFIGTVRDTGQFLPDTASLGRLDDYVIRVGDYIAAYFNSYAENRPAPDSLGRVRFLDSMIRKELLARIAYEADRPLTFEDRLLLGEYRNQVISNVLYQRVVLDQVSISESRVRNLYEQYRRQVRLRHILFKDAALARKVRLDLLGGRIGWSEAVKKYSQSASANGPDGELGWTLRSGKDPYIADVIWALRPGEISEPLTDQDGVHLMQLVEDKPYEAPSLETLRGQLEGVVRQQQLLDSISTTLNARLAEQAGMVYDTTQILYAVSLMPEPLDQSQGIVIQMDAPHVAHEDTARVLARHKNGVITLGAVMTGYGTLNPMLRPDLKSFEAMVHQVQAAGLESYRLELAHSMNLERDSMTVSMMQKREEQLRVEHMYQDSILSKIYIPTADRRAYYEQKKYGFVTYPVVKFAAIHSPTKEGADSLLARLNSGERAADILRADSLSGIRRGSIQTRSQRDRGPYHGLLFDVLTPGQASLVGPDGKGEYAVMQLLERDDGKQLPFEEVDHIIDESLRNMKAEELLLEMIARHKPRYHIETHPELVMQVRLVDPLL